MSADLFINHLGELMVGMVLAVFGFAFKSWSRAISESTTKIINELKNLSAEFHKHRIEVERRVTRIETKVDEIEKRVDGHR
jgi:UDP-glucose 6-dehydrogenase